MPPFDGNGIFTPVSNTFSVPVADTTIDETDAAALWADLATALTTCCTKDGQTASPILTNPKILTKILDTNGNELVDFGTTGSAVNNVRVTNAATGDAAKIDCTETDTNLELDGNGTGYITTNSQRVHGYVILDAGQSLLNAAGAVGWTTFDMSAAGTSAAQSVTDGAVAVVLQVRSTATTSSATPTSHQIALDIGGGGGPGTASVLNNLSVPSGTSQGIVENTFTINVDSNGDFDYTSIDTGMDSVAYRIYLLGYYV